MAENPKVLKIYVEGKTPEAEWRKSIYGDRPPSVDTDLDSVTPLPARLEQTGWQCGQEPNTGKQVTSRSAVHKSYRRSRFRVRMD